MPKKTSPSVSKKKVTKKPIFTMPKPIYLIVGSFAIGLGLIQVGLMTKQAHEDRLLLEDRLRFMTVAQEVNTLAQLLNAAKINDAQWTVESFCSEGNVKFEEATKSCQVTAKTTLEEITSETKKQFIDNVEVIISNNSSFKKISNLRTTPTDFAVKVKEGFGGTSYLSQTTGMQCGSFYRSLAESTQKLSASFACNDEANDFYFPRSDL